MRLARANPRTNAEAEVDALRRFVRAGHTVVRDLLERGWLVCARSDNSNPPLDDLGVDRRNPMRTPLVFASLAQARIRFGIP
jgi:hypothetical protein